LLSVRLVCLSWFVHWEPVPCLVRDLPLIIDKSKSKVVTLVLFAFQSALGLTFDEALGKIVASPEEGTRIITFRGGTSNLYGNLGPADDWLKDFLAKK